MAGFEDRIFRRISGEDLSPEAYDARVDGKGRRTALAGAIADFAAEYVPPVSQKGRPQPFLDIAAGTGIVSRALAEKGYAVTAVDSNPDYLQALHRKSPDITTVQLDMNDHLYRLRVGLLYGLIGSSMIPLILQEGYMIYYDQEEYSYGRILA